MVATFGQVLGQRVLRCQGQFGHEKTEKEGIYPLGHNLEGESCTVSNLIRAPGVRSDAAPRLVNSAPASLFRCPKLRRLETLWTPATKTKTRSADQGRSSGATCASGSSRKTGKLSSMSLGPQPGRHPPASPEISPSRQASNVSSSHLIGFTLIVVSDRAFSWFETGCCR